MKKRSSVRAFFFSFFLSLALLGGVGAGLMVITGDVKPVNEAPSSSYVYQPTEEDALTVLLMGTERDTLPPQRYTLLRFLPEESVLCLVVLPPELEATVNITTGTLPELYDYGGVDAVKQGVENAFFVRVDRYIKASDEELTDFIDHVGGIEYRIEKTVEYEKTGSMVRLIGGLQNLSGKKLLDYRDSPLFTELPEESLLQKRGELLQACLKQKLDQTTVTELEEWFRFLANTMQTDLSRYDFALRTEAFSAFLSDKNKKFVLLLPEGETREEWDGEKFTPSQTMMEEVQKWFEPSEL